MVLFISNFYDMTLLVYNKFELGKIMLRFIYKLHMFTYMYIYMYVQII